MKTERKKNDWRVSSLHEGRWYDEPPIAAGDGAVRRYADAGREEHSDEWDAYVREWELYDSDIPACREDKKARNLVLGVAY